MATIVTTSYWVPAPIIVGYLPGGLTAWVARIEDPTADRSQSLVLVDADTWESEKFGSLREASDAIRDHTTSGYEPIDEIDGKIWA